jgi:hypothetical protein
MYEGRTRGKRMKYTYSDDDMDFMSDETGPRRSSRTTGTHTPAEPTGPVVTASGRHIRAPTRLNAEVQNSEGQSTALGMLDDAPENQDTEMEDSVGLGGRPRRSAAVHHGMNGWTKKQSRKVDEYDSEEDEDSEPDFGDDEEDHIPDETDDDPEEFEEDYEMLDGDDEIGEARRQSLVVTFPVHVSFDREQGKFTKTGKPWTNQKGTKATSNSDRSPSLEMDIKSTSAESESKDESSPEPPVKEAEEISVVTRRKSPEPTQQTIVPTQETSTTLVETQESVLNGLAARAPKQMTPERETNALEPKAAPMTPGSMALAFRGSPEKPPPKTVPRPLDMLSTE